VKSDENIDIAETLKAVGCADNTVRIVSLDPDSTLEVLSTQVSVNTYGRFNFHPLKLTSFDF